MATAVLDAPCHLRAGFRAIANRSRLAAPDNRRTVRAAGSTAAPGYGGARTGQSVARLAPRPSTRPYGVTPQHVGRHLPCQPREKPRP
jgi:hypothetical protein